MLEIQLGQDLIDATLQNSIERVTRILSTNPPLAVVNSAGSGGYTPLHRAALYGHERICSLLLQHGALPNSLSMYNETPLHEAARSGFKTICSLLLDHGAEADSPTLGNWSPMHFAAGNCHGSTCVVLLEHGSSLQMMTNRGITPLALFFRRPSYRKRYTRWAALILIQCIRLQPGASSLTGQNLIEACGKEVALPIHRVVHYQSKRLMEWVGMLECSKMHISSGMYRVFPLPFQRMVKAWLITTAAEWDKKVDGGKDRVSAAVGLLHIDSVERMIVVMATKYMTTM